MDSDAPHAPQPALTWDEPRAIAERLASVLGLPLRDAPEDDAVVLLEAPGLEALSVEQARACAALVIVERAGASTSQALRALHERVTARGVSVALATFATAPTREGPHEAPLVVATPPGDERIPALLAAGPHALTLDCTVDASPDAVSDAPARVCVVTFEVSGMTGGGIGTASTALAVSLARSGHDVTLLFTGWRDADAAEDTERWRTHYAERGIRLALVREGPSLVTTPHFAVSCAYEVYRWLSREPAFDVVHLPDNLGHGTYAQAAKRQGLAFTETTFVVGTHGPTRWAAEANRVVLTREEFLVQDALERDSVAGADVLLGPSRYLHDYLRARGWRLPTRTHVQPYATADALRDPVPGADAAGLRQPPREVVFFGRLETRKGVATLCDALDLLAGEANSPDIEVTFLGPPADVHGTPAETYVAARAQRWPWPWRIIADLDQQGAAAYLRRPGVLAVMPSLVDNAPNTVSEAIALGIPLIASRYGGTGELIAAEQRDDHTFAALPGPAVLPVPLTRPARPTDARPLAELLLRRLTTAFVPARPPVDPAAVDAAYDKWHRAVRGAREDARSSAAAHTLPTLAACVLFDGDERILGEQLDALAGVEVVVADARAHSTAPVALAEARGVPVVQPERPGHAADARTAAVAATSGTLVAIVPPGDVPLPRFAEMLRGAAAATDADVCGCAVLDVHDAPDGATPAEDSPVLVPFPGPPLAGLAQRAFGAGPYAIRRDALARLGGFGADAHGDEVDHELLNRAAAAELRVELVPEPLAVKRRADRWTSMRPLQPPVCEPPYSDEQWLCVMRPLTENGDLLGLLHGARGDTARLERALRDQQAIYEQRGAELRSWIADLEASTTQLRKDRGHLLAAVDALRADEAAMQADRAALVAERTALRAELERRSNVLKLLTSDGRRYARRAARALRRDDAGR
jgi:glycosyltransferase involved in cell wall biosynthesis